MLKALGAFVGEVALKANIIQFLKDPSNTPEVELMTSGTQRILKTSGSGRNLILRSS